MTFFGAGIALVILILGLVMVNDGLAAVLRYLKESKNDHQGH